MKMRNKRNKFDNGNLLKISKSSKQKISRIKSSTKLTDKKDVVDQKIETDSQMNIRNEFKKINRQLRESQQIANIGSWEWDVLNNKIFWSRQLYKIYGLNYKTFKSTYESFLDRLHPDDKERVDNIIKKAFNDKKSFDFIHRIVRPDKTVRTLHGLGKVTVDLKGKVIRMSGTGHDITKEYQLIQSNERYRLVSEGSKDGLIDWINVEKNQQWWSSRLYQMLGYKNHEIPATYSNFIKLLHPKDVKKLENAVKKHFSNLGKTPFEIEYRLKKKTGDYIHVIARGKTIFKNGKPSRMSGTIRDVTERKRIQEEILDREKSFKSIFEQVAVGVVELSIDGKIALANERFSQICGYPVNKLLGTNFKDLTKVTQIMLDFKAIHKSLQGNRKNFYVSEGYYIKEGKKVWVNITIDLVNDKVKGDHFICIVEDITDEVIARNNLEKAYNDLKVLDKEKDQFISITSHELKSPLIPIMGYSEMMLNGDLGKISDKQKESMKVIFRNAESLGNLIEDFLDLSRLDLKRIKIVKKKENIVKIVNDVINNFKTLAQEMNARITIKSTPKLYANCDKLRVKQILSNLVKNAIIHRDTSKKRNLVNISINEKNKYLEINVKDNGRGIPKSEMGKLFSRFYRTEKAIRSTTRGTGLGLVITKSLVELHGGKMSVKSKEDVGSTFTFTLSIE
jgi:two-component system, sensor histidine kinase and response regulator